MRRLVTARRRAERFAEAVDDRAAGRTPRPEHDAEYATFLELVGQLRDIEQPVLRSDFSTDLRSRLMAEAPEALATGPTSGARSRRDSSIVSFPASPRRRTATAVAAACIVLGSTAGVAAASQAALPGQALYPVKRGIENIQLAIAGSQHAKGSQYLDQASTRLDEISDLTVAHADDPTTPTLVRETLESFANDAGDGADALMSAYRSNHDDASISELRQFTVESAKRLDALTGSVPSSAAEALSNAASVLSDLDKQAQQLCPTCSSLPTLTLSSALIELQNTVAEPLAPGSAPTSGVEVPTLGDPQHTGGNATEAGPTNAGPTDAAPTQAPTGSGDDPGSSTPSLPGVTLGGPTGGGPTGQQPNPSPGVTVSVPGGGGVTIGTSIPSVPNVPVPTVSVTIDPNDPVGSIPDVVDDVANGLGLP